MRKVWMGTAAVAALVLVAAGGWMGLSGDAATATQPVTRAVESGAAAPPQPAASTEQAAAQLAQTAGQPEIRPEDHVLGNPDAPVTIIEYASFTCPHCAQFHAETLPKLKSEYIDTGKARLVFRAFPLDQLALRASMLAECMPEDRYFNMVNVLFRTQSDWARAADPVAALEQLGRTAGLGKEAFDRCMADEELVNNIVAGFQEAQNEFSIRSTPSFVVNGTTHAGALPFEEFREILEEQLPES